MSTPREAMLYEDTGRLTWTVVGLNHGHLAALDTSSPDLNTGCRHPSSWQHQVGGSRQDKPLLLCSERLGALVFYSGHWGILHLWGCMCPAPNQLTGLLRPQGFPCKRAGPHVRRPVLNPRRRGRAIPETAQPGWSSSLGHWRGRSA